MQRLGKFTTKFSVLMANFRLGRKGSIGANAFDFFAAESETNEKRFLTLATGQHLAIHQNSHGGTAETVQTAQVKSSLK